MTETEINEDAPPGLKVVASFNVVQDADGRVSLHLVKHEEISPATDLFVGAVWDLFTTWWAGYRARDAHRAQGLRGDE